MRGFEIRDPIEMGGREKVSYRRDEIVLRSILCPPCRTGARDHVASHGPFPVSPRKTRPDENVMWWCQEHSDSPDGGTVMLRMVAYFGTAFLLGTSIFAR
jgi:hypothetical protein